MSGREAFYGYGLVKHGLGTLWCIHIGDRGHAVWEWGDEPALNYATWIEAHKARKRIQKCDPPGDEQILIVPFPKRPHRAPKKTEDKSNAA